jgi:hypothetical protein
MPTPTRLVKLDFGEKLIQSGKKENTEAVLKRIKVGLIGVFVRGLGING